MQVAPIGAPDAAILLAAHGSRRSAFSENHGGDALPHHALGVSVLDQSVVGMIVNIHESRRDSQPGCVNGACSRAARQPSQSGDLTVANAHVTDIRRIARSVDDAPVGDEYVEILSPRHRRQRGKCQQISHRTS